LGTPGRQGVTRIHAAGYSALPFGERYPPLIEFVQRFLEVDRDMGLPQQSTTAWRAALEYNLIQLLAEVAPSHADSQVFFSNSGAEAIEGAIKFVKAFRPAAPYILNFTGGYHGKTYGALSLTPNEEYQAPFRPLMANVVTVKFGDIEAFRTEVDQLGGNNIAGVFLEPIQGEAGVIIPPRNFLEQLGAICEHYGIVIVADEIQVGLGRSGYHFASIEWGGLEPDIITLAKPLGGGIMPVGATIARRDIYHTMLGGLSSKRHSSTFGGNSLAMAVGLKSLELLLENNLAARSRRLGAKSLERLVTIQQRHEHLFEAVRGMGLLLALEFRPVVGPKAAPVQRELIDELSGLLGLLTLHKAGVHANLSLNAKRTIRLTPALNIPEPLLDELLDRVERSADHHAWAVEMLTATAPKTLYGLTRLARGV
jgi:acetylornithine/succinyldiaminopimelate/putrescine aminotransferase